MPHSQFPLDFMFDEEEYPRIGLINLKIKFTR